MAAHRARAAIFPLIFHRLAPQSVGEVRLAAERADGGKRHSTAMAFRAVEADLPLIEGFSQLLAATWTGDVHGMGFVTIVLYWITVT